MFSSILKGLNLCPFCCFSLVVGSLVVLVVDFASMQCKHNFVNGKLFCCSQWIEAGYKERVSHHHT